MRPALILLALPLLGAARPDEPVAPAGKAATSLPAEGGDCRLLTETGDRGIARFRKLTDLPPANSYAAMLRTDEKGCPQPVLYRPR